MKSKVTFSYTSLADWSNLQHATSLLDALADHDLIIERVGNAEPIRHLFEPASLPTWWKGVGPEGGHSTCYFLFKGQGKLRFSGMVVWNKNLGARSRAFNGLSVWLTLPKGCDPSQLIQLGDALFTWSSAVFGYITLAEYDQTPKRPGHITQWLPAPMWVNYYGPEYFTNDDFHLPDSHVCVSHGVRVLLAHRADDLILGDQEHLQAAKARIGLPWFGEGPRSGYRVPVFDRTAITRA